jgi:hypothetical protein
MGISGFGTDATFPGTVDPFSSNLLAGLTGNEMAADRNRYAQLGLSGGVGPHAAQQAAASGTNVQNTGIQSTPLAMEQGNIPSPSGGIPGAAAATYGQMAVNAINQPSGSAGSTKGSLGPAGIAGLLA